MAVPQSTMQAILRICCWSIPVIFTLNGASHTQLLGSGDHLHGDGEHTRIGCEGHAGCEHHLLTVTMKGTVVWAPSCRQGKGNVYLLVGFPAYEREIVLVFFFVIKGKNSCIYYSLGFEWILKSNPLRNHPLAHRSRISAFVRSLSQTLSLLT